MKQGLSLIVLLFPLMLSVGQGYGEDFGRISTLSVNPPSHDFGVLSVPLESKTQVFTISNSANTAIVLSDVILSDTDNYSLDMNAGPDPCGSATSKIAAGGECTFAVTFYPQSQGILDANITIVSNNPDMPRISVPLKGFGLLCYC